jgi:SAM-dependent methyltransferase
MEDSEFLQFFSGKRLIGDDFTLAEIEAWFADEAEAYANLGAKDKDSYTYGYHALNALHGYKGLPVPENAQVLGFGSAYGDELSPLLSKASRVTIVDPSDEFVMTDREGVPITFVKPVPSGKLPFENDSFDIITCLGVLHHIPNVSFVIQELGRVLRPGGFALIREPIVNMGDWRKPRLGLTRRERGIPKEYMESAIAKGNMSVWRSTPCIFPLTPRISKLIGVRFPFNSPPMARLDKILCTLTHWNCRYDRRTIMQKICPTSHFWVCKSMKLPGASAQ